MPAATHEHTRCCCCSTQRGFGCKSEGIGGILPRTIFTQFEYERTDKIQCFAQHLYEDLWDLFCSGQAPAAL